MIGSDPAPAQRGQSGESRSQQSLPCHCDTTRRRGINVCVGSDGAGWKVERGVGGVEMAFNREAVLKMSSEEVS